MRRQAAGNNLTDHRPEATRLAWEVVTAPSTAMGATVTVDMARRLRERTAQLEGDDAQTQALLERLLCVYGFATLHLAVLTHSTVNDIRSIRDQRGPATAATRRGVARLVAFCDLAHELGDFAEPTDVTTWMSDDSPPLGHSAAAALYHDGAAADLLAHVAGHRTIERIAALHRPDIDDPTPT